MPPEKNGNLDRFIAYLEGNDREGAVSFALSLLQSGALSVPELYETVLAPSLNRIEVPREKENSLIWREHLMSSIVRTVIEAAYPYVLNERAKAAPAGSGGLVMLACPQEEYHEIGIRMGADYFTILGYEVAYIGCNTPMHTLLDAARALKPDIVAIGVTNYLNLIQLPVIIAALKALQPAPRVYLSGTALAHAGRDADDFNAEGMLDTFTSIQALREEKA